MSASRYIRWFSEISNGDVAQVGGKNASLGEMYQFLSNAGINVPNGFAVTADAYWQIVASDNISEKLQALLSDVQEDDTAALESKALAARELILNAEFPVQLQVDITTAYRQLESEYGENVSVAVRSSATAEDLPNASFAGQHDSYLNIAGDDQLIKACKRCFASLFTSRAILYRMHQGFDQFKVALSICIMKMVRSDLAASGVMFTLDTETGFKDVVYITGAFGLGENVVQGAVDPDEFYVHKPTFTQGYQHVLKQSLGAKQIKMVFAEGRTDEPTRNIDTPANERNTYCLDSAEVLTLTGYAIKIEEHYSERAHRYTPMDIEWAKDGVDGKLYIVQARPETVASQRGLTRIEQYEIHTDAEPIVKGNAVGTRVAQGVARVIKNVSELNQFKPGEILVADMTTPDWGTVMKQAAAIVTNRGGRTCHAAIVARELSVPAIVGTGNATQAIKSGDEITVSCAQGNIGRVYAGKVPYKVHDIEMQSMQRPRTKIMMNIANPELAFKQAMLPNDGVGLARLEFIINEYIKIHPLAFLFPEQLSNEKLQDKIKQLSKQNADPEEFFINKLSEGISVIAAAFYPNPVIVRLSDFKSNEYASLLGGDAFEPKEENPMLGFRGASRYIHPEFIEAFRLECRALKRVREEMGLSNVKIMVPFCRRVDEAKKVFRVMEKFGLKRGEHDLQVYMMCEIPNNVLLIDEFAQLFDGFSIGSNDLTQLILGVDRDSDLVAFEFDERDAGVKKAIQMAVEGAKRNNRHVGICGQAPSDYADFARFLVDIGIESMSLNPDAVLKTTQMIVEYENKIVNAIKTK